jgi:CheY-like chemotaxis protein
MAHGSRGHQVLLVDDEEIFLSSLFEGLCRRFPDVTFRTAHDGHAALDQLGKHSVDLVITDLKMPRMDGFRSEERRVGKECRRLCRSRWSPYH